METSIRELRTSMKRIFDYVQQGEEVLVYLREKPIAKIVPIEKPMTPKEDYGFGMWRDRDKMADVDQYIRKLRKGRTHDF